MGGGGLPAELQLVADRVEFLEALDGEPVAKRDLVDALECSRSTVDRAVRDLETAGLVERTGGGYVTTLTGRIAADCYREYLADGRAILGARPVLGALPPDADVPVAFLADATVAAGDGAPLFQRVTGLLGDAESYRAALPRLSDSRHLRLLCARVREGGLEAELVAPGSLLDRLTEEFPHTATELAGADGFTAHRAGTPPFGLVLARRDGEPTAAVLAYEGDDLAGVLHNDAPAAVEWATGRLDALRLDAERATDDLRSAEDAATVPPLGRPGVLPLSLRSEGFVRVDEAYFERRSSAPPATAWRTGLDLAEIREGYALDREYDPPDGEGRTDLAAALVDRLRGGEDCAVLGPPGSGKSTVCRQVASRWFAAGKPTFYRAGGADEPFDSVARLRDRLERADGHALVVVEDAVRPAANAVFEVMRSLRDRDDVTFLLDAREDEWHDPSTFPADAGLVAYKDEAVGTVQMPPLDERECERFRDHFEATVGASVDIPAEELLAGVRRADTDRAQPGEVYLLAHRLALHVDPLVGYDSATPTTLVEDVQRTYRALADAGETALEVGLLVNLLNAAGIGVAPEFVHALGVDHGHVAVRDALSVLEGRVLFGDPGDYRTVHESWSTLFLDHLLDAEGDRAAHRRFGGALSALLALADDPDRRAAVEHELVGEAPRLADIAETPGEWADALVEQVRAFGREYPGLAPLFGRTGYSRIDLPAACSADAGLRCALARGEMYLDAGYLDAAEAEFEELADRVEADGPVDEHEAASIEARCLLKLGETARRRGAHDAAESYARRALSRYRDLDDGAGRARALNNIGVVAGARGDLETALEYLERSRDLRREVGDRRGLSKAYNNLGIVAAKRGDLAAAEEYVRESLDIDRALGNRSGMASSYNNLGRIARLRDDHGDAADYYRRSCDINREVGDRPGVARALFNIGQVAADRGDLGEAVEFVERSLDIRRGVGDRKGEADCHAELGRVARERGDLGAARDHLDAAVECYRETGAAGETVEAVETLVEVCAEAGDHAAAADYCETGATIAAEAGMAEKREALEERCAQLH